MKNYFVTTDRGIVIQEKPNNWVKPENNNDFEQFTPEMEAFYTLNPTASINEIRNCALNVINLEEYKAQKIEELSNLSKSTGFSLLTLEQRENLDCNLPNLSYTQEQRINLNKNCRDEFYRVKELIEAATTKSEADEAFNSNNYANITI